MKHPTQFCLDGDCDLGLPYENYCLQCVLLFKVVQIFFKSPYTQIKEQRRGEGREFRITILNLTHITLKCLCQLNKNNTNLNIVHIENK